MVLTVVDVTERMRHLPFLTHSSPLLSTYSRSLFLSQTTFPEFTITSVLLIDTKREPKRYFHRHVQSRIMVVADEHPHQKPKTFTHLHSTSSARHRHDETRARPLFRKNQVAESATIPPVTRWFCSRLYLEPRNGGSYPPTQNNMTGFYIVTNVTKSHPFHYSKGRCSRHTSSRNVLQASKSLIAGQIAFECFFIHLLIVQI